MIVPSAAYRQGDFSSISPNGGANFNPLLGVPLGPLGSPGPSLDPLNRTILANTIYDPSSERPGQMAYRHGAAVLRKSQRPIMGHT